MIRRPPRSTQSRSSAASDVYKRQNYSMFAEIVCKDITQLRFVLHDQLQKIKGIERTETFISLEESFSRNVKVM